MGDIKPAKTMIFREAVGEAQDPDGNKYELSTNVGNGCPIIRSGKTNRWFILPWSDIIQLAQEAGIDSEDSKESP